INTSVPLIRVQWPSNDLSIAYHDKEWGVPVHDDRTLFEFLTLEGAQAGLSWDTVLKKRERYRQLFVGFDPEKVARYDRKKVRTLLKDPGIIRNRLQIESTVSNANALLQGQKEFGSSNKNLWTFVSGKAIQNAWKTHVGLPAFT